MGRLYGHRQQLFIGMAIVAIAAGQRIGAAYLALIMAMHMHQNSRMATKLTLIHH
jgi:hypothetical protein